MSWKNMKPALKDGIRLCENIRREPFFPESINENKNLIKKLHKNLGLSTQKIGVCLGFTKGNFDSDLIDNVVLEIRDVLGYDSWDEYHKAQRKNRRNLRRESGFTQEKKEKVKTRDNFNCQKCGRSKENISGSLEVHHKDRNSFNNSLGNLVTLCKSCHREKHYYKYD